MADDAFVSKDNPKKAKDKKKKKKKRGGTKKKMTAEQTLAFKAVTEWVYLDQQSSPLVPSSACVVDDFGVQKTITRGGHKICERKATMGLEDDGLLLLCIVVVVHVQMMGLLRLLLLRLLLLVDHHFFFIQGSKKRH